MTRRIELVGAGGSAGRTLYRVMAGDAQVGTAVELAADHAAPWRLTVPGRCTDLPRGSRRVVLATVGRLLDARPGRAVVYVPASPGSRWADVAAELHAAGFEIHPAPMPTTPRVLSSPMILCPGEA